jgi:hypothetical protein
LDFIEILHYTNIFRDGFEQSLCDVPYLCTLGSLIKTVSSFYSCYKSFQRISRLKLNVSVMRNNYESLEVAWQAPYLSIEQTNDDGDLNACCASNFCMEYDGLSFSERSSIAQQHSIASTIPRSYRSIWWG